MIHQTKLISYVIVALLLQLSTTQDSMTFSPSLPLCIGEEVQMICYVVSPTADQFVGSVALISFNDSSVATITNINDNSLAAIDTARYTAAVTGLTITTARPGIRLTITDYQASDGATNFSCHGMYSTANGGVSPAIISGYPQTLAEAISLSDNDGQISIQILEDLSITVNAILLSQFERDDTLNYTYTLDASTSSESSSTPNNSYTFVTGFTCDVCYRVSYSAENCAGGSGAIYSGYFGLQRVHNTTGKLKQSPSNPKRIEWVYNEFLCNGMEENYLSEECFNFSIINTLTGDRSNVTNSSLNFPHGFFVEIPQHIDLTTNDYSLEIVFIDPCFNVTIPVIIVVDDVGESPILTVILSVLAILLILFIVLVAIIVAILLIVIHHKKKPPTNK